MLSSTRMTFHSKEITIVYNIFALKSQVACVMQTTNKDKITSRLTFVMSICNVTSEGRSVYRKQNITLSLSLTLMIGMETSEDQTFVAKLNSIQDCNKE